MPSMGGWEWVIILVVVLLLFGVGRVAELGKELGVGIRAFREGLHEGQETDAEDEEPAENKANE
jgi:sec-independent protein translocase protein TatA